MMGCKAIRKQIDEADRPDAFSFEVSGHLASCEGCRQFADERARLREMISMEPRVQAPAHFDAALRARLEAAKSRPAFSWLAPAALMRMSAAAAAAVIVVFVAQYALVPEIKTPSDPALSNGEAGPKSIQPPSASVQPAPSDGGQTAGAPLTSNTIPPAPQRMNKRATSRIDPDLAALDPHMVIVRGERGDREVPIFTVSVGAQPHLYGARSAPVARLAKASF
ncbi:MAG: hypothetical protein AB1631_04645 [Acidobacteriota bacterium]